MYDGAKWLTTLAILAGLAATVAVPAGASNDAQLRGPQPKAHGAQVGFWTGQNTTRCNNADPTTCPRDLSAYTPAVWRALARGHGALYFDLVYTVDFGPGAFRNDALPILREANRRGVAVKAWFTNPLDHGTYANEDNADYELAAVKAFRAWRDAHHLRIPEVVLDLEFPAGYQAVVDATDPAKLAADRGTIDPVHQCDAVRGYRRLISWGHGHGLVISGSPMPFLLDDLDNGDMALADAIDAAPMISGGYDHLYLQAYRTYSNTGANYPSGYLQRVHHYFGRAGEISLGDTTMGPPYDAVGALVKDVRIATALGATAIPIFELASSVQKYGARGVQKILEAGRDPLPQKQVAAATPGNTMTSATLDFFDGLDTAATATSPHANPWPAACD